MPGATMNTAPPSRHYYYSPAPAHYKTLPITMPSKSHPTTYSRTAAASPPEFSDASTTSGSRASYSANSSSYAGSVSNDYETSSGYGGVDVVDMLSERMERAFEPMRMDRSLATQAQTSGQLNAKQRELLELQALAQRRMKGARARYSEGMKAAKETKRDIEWTQKKVSSMKSKAERMHPESYKRAKGRYYADDE